MILEIVGWIGAVLILLAYGLLTKGHIKSFSRSYNTLNLFGGVLLLLSAASHGAIAVGTLNGLFALIAAWALVRRLI